MKSVKIELGMAESVKKFVNVVNKYPYEIDLRSGRFLIDAKSKLPQLEASKKAAVASKNFRGAQQINKQITTITEQVQKNEAIVSDTTQRLENLEGEATTLSDEIARAQVEAEESKIQLLQLDHDFFQSAVTELQSLFSISPFGERLLSPLFKMFEFALAHTEVPKQLSKEELEAELARLQDELNNAVEIEDFDTLPVLDRVSEGLKYIFTGRANCAPLAISYTAEDPRVTAARQEADRLRQRLAEQEAIIRRYQ